jgi:hypothetical protein
MKSFIMFMLAVVGMAARKKSPAGSEAPFQASQWITEILCFVENFGQPRTIEVLDFFAGNANICKRARHHGFSAETFEIELDKEQDILTRTGFFLALTLCCQA